MVSNSQLKRIPGVQKAYQFARDTMHPGGYDHWIRIVMDQETARLVRGLDVQHSSALEISGAKWKDFGFARYKSVGYPDYDVCAGVLEEKFDVILAEQVFEHVLWPYRGVRNVFQMLKPNGAFLITTPFLVKIHGFPVVVWALARK
jgi:2-polyprenyl-3-methyl-5-hydroxy-6-metoxy-1,4-benzoquinol methylase